jgi:hypothetical protein
MAIGPTYLQPSWVNPDEGRGFGAIVRVAAQLRAWCFLMGFPLGTASKSQKNPWFIRFYGDFMVI